MLKKLIFNPIIILMNQIFNIISIIIIVNDTR